MTTIRSPQQGSFLASAQKQSANRSSRSLTAAGVLVLGLVISNAPSSCHAHLKPELERTIESASKTQGSLSNLEDINELYRWDDFSEVRRMLLAHPELHGPLIQAAIVVPSIFGTSAFLSLRVVREIDADGRKSLLASIHTGVDPEVALDQIDQFDHAWWLGLMPQLHKTLSFGLRFE